MGPIRFVYAGAEPKLILIFWGEVLMNRHYITMLALLPLPVIDNMKWSHRLYSR